MSISEGLVETDFRLVVGEDKLVESCATSIAAGNSTDMRFRGVGTDHEELVVTTIRDQVMGIEFCGRKARVFRKTQTSDGLKITVTDPDEPGTTWLQILIDEDKFIESVEVMSGG